MNVEITETIEGDAGRTIEAVCGKKKAVIGVYCFGGKMNRVWVCCQNASLEAWRGLGRSFLNEDEATAAYKSPEMRAIIEEANRLDS